MVEALVEFTPLVLVAKLDTPWSWLSTMTLFFFVIFSEWVAFEDPSFSWSDSAALKELSLLYLFGLDEIPSTTIFELTTLTCPFSSSEPEVSLSSNFFGSDLRFIFGGLSAGSMRSYFC